MHVSVDHKARIAWVIGHEHPIASFAFEEWGGASGASVAAQRYVEGDNDGWHDIDTAPRDGTDILAWCSDHQEQVVLFFSQHGSGWTAGNPNVKYNPTHWMDLPDPPEQT